MSLDTRDKRAAAAAAGLVWLLVAPTPDGGITGAEDRVHVAGLARIAPVEDTATTWRVRLRETHVPELAERAGVAIAERGTLFVLEDPR